MTQEETTQTRLATRAPTQTPNDAQQQLIETLEGPVLCDAGAGTGKTFTIAKRYLHLLNEKALTPQEILLITFTNNAADEMRERILRLGDDITSPTELHDAPISTFHALAKRLLERHGFNVADHLGLDANLSPGFTIIGDQVDETDLFDDFLRRFRDRNPEHQGFFASLHDPSNLLELLHELAAKGILPTREGWYRDSKALLLGDQESYMEAFEEANTPDGNAQSPARKRFYDAARGKLFHPLSRDREDAVTDKKIRHEAVEKAWRTPRDELIQFLHDVYVGYLEYAIQRNRLNFQFLLLLAYVLLIEEPGVRDEEQFEHVMIDEFQDTSEIQLQLALLYASEPNLCCVGDWKQSIYSFQFASVDNILTFEDRVHRFSKRLNDDEQRVPSPDDLASPERIQLTENYRSSQPILDLAPKALECPATQSEATPTYPVNDLQTLQSRTPTDESTIQALACQNEPENILALLQDIVDNPEYTLHQEATVDGEDTVLTRPPTYEDIAVLTRTRSFALNLQEKAREIGLPVAFEGGVEIYKTDEAKLLLAWLRLLEDHRSKRGWAVILEHAGYTLDEIAHVLDEHAYPERIKSFLDDLRNLPTPSAQARSIFQAYDLFNGYTEALIANLQDAYESTQRTPGELVRLLEDHHDAGTIEDVDDHPGGDVVTLQTIHAAKGLEYPIVLLADVNEGRFPSRGGGYPNRLRYDERLGIHLSKRFIDEPGTPPFVYDDWQYTLLNSILDSTDYDEERRLFYVALSRAKQHLLVTADVDRASPFFTNLPLEPTTVDPTPEQEGTRQKAPSPPEIHLPDHEVPRSIPVGDLVPRPDLPEGGRGRLFGERIHKYAARAAKSKAPDPGNRHERNVVRFLQEQRERGLTAEPEVDARLPIRHEGQRTIVEGKIDLVCHDDTRVVLADWKTTPPGAGLEAYAEQVGLYARTAQQAHPEKTIEAWIVYTEDGHRERVQPTPLAEIKEKLRDARTTHAGP